MMFLLLSDIEGSVKVTEKVKMDLISQLSQSLRYALFRFANYPWTSLPGSSFFFLLSWNCDMNVDDTVVVTVHPCS